MPDPTSDPLFRQCAQIAAPDMRAIKREAAIRGMVEALLYYSNYDGNTFRGAYMTPYIGGKPDPNKPKNDRGYIARAALAAFRAVEEQ